MGGDAQARCFGEDFSGSAGAPGGQAIPDRNEEIAAFKHLKTGKAVAFRPRTWRSEFMNGCTLCKQFGGHFPFAG